MVARFEVDRANRKVERAANQRLHESKKQRQNFSISNQGPSHGPGYTRPHTMIYQKGLKEGACSSMASLSNHPKQFNRRRTENTIFHQDYLRQWTKIQKITPVLETSKVSQSISANTTGFNTTVNNSMSICLGAEATKSTRTAKGTVLSTKNSFCNFNGTRGSTMMSTNDSARISANNQSYTRRTTSTSYLGMNESLHGRMSRNRSFGATQGSSYMKPTKASRSKQAIR